MFKKYYLMIIKSIFMIVLLLGISNRGTASVLTVDVLSMTLTAQSLSGMSITNVDPASDYILLPFYLRAFIPPSNNTFWGLEIYTNNKIKFPSITSSDNLYRGLRNVSNVNNHLPLYWQVYPDDLNVSLSYGTPQSVTSVAGELGFYANTLTDYWQEIYDRTDEDMIAQWDSSRDKRLLATVTSLGNAPRAARQYENKPVYIYLGSDIRNVIGANSYIGRLNIDLFHYGFDLNRGGYATPNPVKPIHGDRVYFNFYTNNPSSGITIKVFDPTGYPVRTIKDDRYWDCRNDSGHLVEGGLYLYQIEVESRIISGTVVVIK